jgi:predicted AlkP superfamily phosphohydrolase/phosphomutase
MRFWPFVRGRKRLFVLGLDGVPQSFFENMCARRLLPRLSALLGGRKLLRMNSCYPTVSNVAWSCFQTGKNPGGFGIYGFADLTPSMDLTIPNSTDLKSRTIWEILSDAGKRVIGLGVPCTHPPRDVNGVLVGGFLAPTLEQTVHPPDRLPFFKKWGYRLDVDPGKARESLGNLRRDLIACLAGRERALNGLWHSHWDLFVLHVMETDRINHFMWKFQEEPLSVDGRFFMEFYRNIDNLIGSIADRLDEDTEFILLSDHGFCRVRKEVQLNRWLEQRGYLSYAGDPANGFKSLSPDSKAVALVPGRIHILQRGKWERGGVEPNDYESVRGGIIEALNQWSDEEAGEPICANVFRREELFTGPHAGKAPDIVAHPRDGYDFKAALGPGDLFTHSPLNGMHTHHDAMLFINGHEIEGPKPVIWDLAPTILKMLGLEPEGMDGRVLV